MTICSGSFERSKWLRSDACRVGVEGIQLFHPLVGQPFGRRLQKDLARLSKEYDDAVLDYKMEALVYEQRAAWDAILGSSVPRYARVGDDDPSVAPQSKIITLKKVK